MSINKKEADRKLASNDVKTICDTLVEIAFYEEDWKWVQEKCLFFLMDENAAISGLAATCLGHIARIHREKIEKDRVIKALRDRLDDSRISGRIEDALDDIQMFT